MSAKTTHCPKCSTPLPSDAPKGLCPECLLRGGFESAEEAESSHPAGPPRDRTIHIVVPVDQSAVGVPENLRFFGDYELLEQIAVGGMGMVFKAQQVSLNRLVAVKMIRAGQLAREADIRRFRTEAEAAANLKHPHIVAIHEVGEHQGWHYFSMDFIEGHSLADVVRDRPLEPARAARLVQTVAEAIAYAHQRGVLHRDLKPSNVMIDAQDQPHVTDFGLAKLLKGDSELTHTGAVLGSPSYMSPEQARGLGDQVGVRSDVYALGAMLYELLTTRPPFLAPTALETMKLVAESEPLGPRTLDPSVPRDLETICLKCLQKDPAHRYSSAEALAEDLARWQRHEPIRARPSTAWESAWKWAKRHPARAGLILLATITPAAIIAVLIISRANVGRERNHALQQEQKAIAALIRAELSERAARERAYAADVYAAFQALAVNDLALARRLLNEHKPVATGATPTTAAPDLRGFEWCALWERSRGQEAFAFSNLPRPAECLVFAPDGRTLVSGGGDGIHLWDIAERRSLGLFPGPDPGPTDGDRAPTLEEMRPLLEASPAVVDHLHAHPPVLDYLDALGHTNRTRGVHSLAFSPDGKHLLVGSRDYLRSWDFVTRAFEFALPEEHATVATPSSGDLLVVGNNQRHDPNDDVQSAHPQSALIYSFTRRRLVAELRGYGRRIALSPDGQSVAAVGSTNVPVLWRHSTGEITPVSHNWQSDGLLAFSPSGRTLLVGADSRRFLRDLASGRIRAYLTGGSLSGPAVWSPDGRTVAAAGQKQGIGLWTAPSETASDGPLAEPLSLSPTTILRGHAGAVTALAFSRDGRWLASTASDCSIRLWPMADTPTVAAAPGSSPHSVSLFGRVMDPETGSIVVRIGKQLTVLEASPDCASNSLSGTERHLHAGFLAQGQGFVTLELRTNGLPACLEIRRLPDGLVQARREIIPATGEPIYSHNARLHFPVASPDGRWLAVGMDGGEAVHVFALETGRQLARLAGSPNALLWGLFVSPDSRWLVRLGYHDGRNQIIFYDRENWKVAREVSFPSAAVELALATIDPTSHFIATAGLGENSLRVWDLLTGRLLAHYNSGTGWHPVWSRDGRMLVVREGEMLRFWSMIVFRELAAFPVNRNNTSVPLGFTKDGRSLLALDRAGQPITWTPPTLAEIDREP